MRVTEIVGSFFDRTFARVTVASSSLSPDTGQPLYDVSGAGLSDDPTDSKGESKDAQEGYSAGGVVFRPLAPEKGQDLFLEALAVRTSDGLVPMVYRDKRILERINRGGGVAPKEGQILYAGYGGAFLSYEFQATDTRDNVMMYVPYERNGAGVPTKAHIITLGKDGSGKPLVSVISGEGPRLVLLEDKGQLVNKDGTSWLEVAPDGVNVVGNFKVFGACDLNGVTIDAVGNLSAPLEVAAMASAVPVHLSLHLHPTAMGPSGLPVG